MKWMLLLFILLYIFPLFARGETYVVMPFKAVNCNKQKGEMITELIRYSIAKDSYLKVVTKRKTEAVLAILGDFNCNTKECSKYVTRVLKADKLIYGTIEIVKNKKTQKKTYKIEAYIVVKNPWEFEKDRYKITTATSKTLAKIIKSSIEKLEKLDLEEYKNILEANNRLKNVSDKNRKGSTLSKKQSGDGHSFLFYASTAYSMPVGKFTELIQPGPGIDLGVMYKSFSVFIVNFDISLQSGIYYYQGNAESVEYVMMIPAQAIVSKSFSLFKSFFFQTGIGVGAMTSVMSYDNQRRSSEAYSYSQGVFVDAYTNIKGEFLYSLTDNLQMTVSSNMGLLFEESTVGTMTGFSSGVRFSF